MWDRALVRRRSQHSKAISLSLFAIKCTPCFFHHYHSDGWMESDVSFLAVAHDSAQKLPKLPLSGRGPVNTFSWTHRGGAICGFEGVTSPLLIWHTTLLHRHFFFFFSDVLFSVFPPASSSFPIWMPFFSTVPVLFFRPFAAVYPEREHTADIIISRPMEIRNSPFCLVRSAGPKDAVLRR